MPTKYNPNEIWPSHNQVRAAYDYWMRCERWHKFCCYACCAEDRQKIEFAKGTDPFNQSGWPKWWFAEWECILECYPEDFFQVTEWEK